MTGLSAGGNRLFLSSRNQNRVYTYLLPNVAARSEFTFLAGQTNTCDIAINTDDSLVWVASENTSLAVACFNSSNTMVDYIDVSLIPNARGLALDQSGYLWISDTESEKIYKVDLSGGIGSEQHGTHELPVVVSSNPFVGMVTIRVPEVDASVTVFDTFGRQIERASFHDTWIWNSSAPSGHYVFVVKSEYGASATIDMVKL